MGGFQRLASMREMVVSGEKISEPYLIAALEQLPDDVPFVIRGFHSDNGSGTSTSRWQSCLRNYGPNSPGHAPAENRKTL